MAECSLPFAVATGDFNRQFLGQMTQLNQLLGEVKDLLRQQVTTRTPHQKTPVLPESSSYELVGLQGLQRRGDGPGGRP